jgi:hypothetical protein
MGLVDIVERITFRAESLDEQPFTLSFPLPFYIVSNWWKEDEDDDLDQYTRIRFISPEGTELVNEEQRLEFENSVKLRISGQIGSLPYTVNGIYEFEVAYRKNEKWEIAARIPLEIVHEQPEPEQPESELTS